jgi:2-dehydropantoate 2-reductase
LRESNGKDRKMRILVYGAGVQGSVFAASLHRAGYEVKILARGKRLADIREHGIVLERLGTPGQHVDRVPVAERLEPADAFDLVILTMQKGQIGDVLPVLAASERIPAMAFFMNNVAGADELVRALGAERVILGFGLMGGIRDGSVVRWASGEKKPRLFEAVLGELDGSVTPRLQEIRMALEKAGIRGSVQSNMDAWLKAHWALVGPISRALNSVGNDTHRLAADRQLLRLMVEAQREGFRVIRALGLPLAPTRLKLMLRLPIWMSVAVVRRLLKTEFAKLALAGHAAVGGAEFRLLDQEFRRLIEKTSLPTPAIDGLFSRAPVEERPAAHVGGK